MTFSVLSPPSGELYVSENANNYEAAARPGFLSDGSILYFRHVGAPERIDYGYFRPIPFCHSLSVTLDFADRYPLNFRN